jgi:hypothetical protein
MKHLLICLSLVLPLLPLPASDSPAPEKATVIVAVGAAGEEEYGQNFQKWAALWEKAAQAGGANVFSVGLSTNVDSSDRDRLKQLLEAEPKEGASEVWLVLLGHGTFDGKEAKFNLIGPDVSASDLDEWLRPLQRPLAIIDTSSASAPFLKKLSAAGRVIVTGTKSGYQQNYARFGQFISETIADLQSDLDKDGQTSLLEAFLMASRRVAEFYETDGRLATEHALLDDNGDGLGTQADWFRGIHAVKKPTGGAALDGLRSHQIHLIRSPQEQKMPPELRAKRDQLEVQIAKLRETKSQVAEDQYYQQLEVLLLELAHIYDEQAQSGH